MADLTPVEKIIMDSVWAGNKTTRAIYDALPEVTQKRMTFSTISTYLMRMVQKGYLKRSPTSGREFEYTACVDELATSESLYQEAEKPKHFRVLAKRFSGQISSGILSPKQQEALRKIAETLEKHLGEKGHRPKE